VWQPTHQQLHPCKSWRLEPVPHFSRRTDFQFSLRQKPPLRVHQPQHARWLLLLLRLVLVRRSRSCCLLLLAAACCCLLLLLLLPPRRPSCKSLRGGVSKAPRLSYHRAQDSPCLQNCRRSRIGGLARAVSHAERMAARARASNAAHWIRRCHARVLRTELHLRNILRRIFHARVSPLLLRILPVPTGIHAVEHVQRPPVRLAERLKIRHWQPPPSRHIVRWPLVGPGIRLDLVPLGSARFRRRCAALLRLLALVPPPPPPPPTHHSSPPATTLASPTSNSTTPPFSPISPSQSPVAQPFAPRPLLALQ